MKDLQLRSKIAQCQLEELTAKEQKLVELAIAATERSYAKYSRFHVGAAIMLRNGEMLMGCNQENAAFPAGICAERSAIFAAGVQYPDEPVTTIAIAARDTTGQLTIDPVSPCGTCRQVMIETETRFRHPLRIILYGQERIFVMDGIKNLMPLSFTEF